MNKNSSKVVSFGCRLNSMEAEIIKKYADKINHNVLVINSCGVTNEAERQLRQFIRKEKKNNPDVNIILTGCASELDPEKYEQMPEVDYIIPNISKLDESIWDNLESLDSYTQDKEYILPPIIENFEGKERAFIQIQNGCDRTCTYCATRLARGKSISFPSEHIIKQVNALKKYNEIVITGVNITSYSYNNSPLEGESKSSQELLGGEYYNLKDLIKLILKETDVPRIRFSSLDIGDVDDEFISILKESRIMPHFHFSLQAGDNEILKKMARKHTREEAIEKIQKIRNIRPESTFGADIITGFPTETEEMFNNSINMVKEANICFLHVFPYSEKANTVAAKMPQMDNTIRKQRAKKLRDTGHQLMSDYLKTKIGKKTMSIIEGGHIARADDYSKIKIEEDVEIGSIQEIKIIEDKDKTTLRGKVCLKN